LCNGGEEEAGIANSSQGHKAHAIGVALPQLDGHLNGEAGLANATGTQQSQQMHLWTGELGADHRHVLFAPHQRC
jgi:hypothetical protein